jgi:uncharacterized membrane protein YfcA
VLTLLFLFAAGLLAGTMNALAGGGTFAAFPALMAAGLPPTVANATSNTALLPGAAASAWTYRHDLKPFGPLSLKWMFALTVAGGGVGAVLLHLTTERTFSFIIPWLLLMASLMLTFSAPVRRMLERTHWKMGAAGAAGLQFALGVYGGYFGGAVGLISMAAWVLITDAGAKDLAPARTLFLMAANAAACVLFVALDLISWSHVLPVAIGAVTGGYLGARVGMRLPSHAVRWAVLSITYVTTAVFFWRFYA